MPVFHLQKEVIFPSPELAEEDGLLAIGGDLSEERVLFAYSRGIFPWYSDGSPVLWWSPDPRLVLFPQDLHVSRSLRQTLRKGIFHVTFDTAFDDVIRGCARVRRKRERGTWITEEMIGAYTTLHRLGYVHSVESWYGGELAGGLYGVTLGAAFFGESMFAKKTDASKVAFVSLVRKLQKWKFTLIDCQITTDHLMRLGAHEIPRSEFLVLLREALCRKTRKGNWGEM